MSVDLYQLKEEEKQRCWVVFSRALAAFNSAYIQTPSVGVKTDAQATSSAPSGTYSQSGAPQISNAATVVIAGQLPGLHPILFLLRARTSALATVPEESRHHSLIMSQTSFPLAHL